MKAITVTELRDELDKAIKNGYGDCFVYYDTEGKEYAFHMAAVESLETIPEDIVDERKWVILHGE